MMETRQVGGEAGRTGRRWGLAASRRAFGVRAGTVMAGAALAACGGPAAQQAVPTAQPTASPVRAPVTVELMTTWTDMPNRVLHRRFVDDVAARLKQRLPHLTLDHQSQGGSTINDSLVSRIVAGNPWDVTGISGYWPYERANDFLNLQPKIARDRVDMTMYVPLIDGLNLNGAVYGLPYADGPATMYLNLTLFKKRGVAPPPANWTWDDYFTIAQKLTGDGDFGLLHRAVFEDTWLPFLRSAGGDWINKEKTKTTLDTPIARDVFQWLVDLHLKHNVAMDNRDEQYGTGDTPFLRGRIGIYPRNTGLIPTLQETIKEFEWDIVSRPVHPGTKQAVDLHTQSAWGIPAGSKKQDDAWEVVKELTGEWAGDVIGRTKIATPATKKALADRTGYAAPPPASMSVVLKALEKPSDQSFSKNWRMWVPEIYKVIQTMFTGEVGVNNALVEATRIGDVILAR